MRKSIILCLSAVALAFTACNNNTEQQKATEETPMESSLAEVNIAEVDTTTTTQSIVHEQNADKAPNTDKTNQQEKKQESVTLPIDPSFIVNNKNVSGNLKKYGFTKTGTRYEESPFAYQEDDSIRIKTYTRNINGKKVTCEITDYDEYTLTFSDSKEKEQFIKAVKALGCGKQGSEQMFDANKWYVVHGRSVTLGSGGD